MCLVLSWPYRYPAFQALLTAEPGLSPVCIPDTFIKSQFVISISSILFHCSTHLILQTIVPIYCSHYSFVEYFDVRSCNALSLVLFLQYCIGFWSSSVTLYTIQDHFCLFHMDCHCQLDLDCLGSTDGFEVFSQISFICGSCKCIYRHFILLLSWQLL